MISYNLLNKMNDAVRTVKRIIIRNYLEKRVIIYILAPCSFVVHYKFLCWPMIYINIYIYKVNVLEQNLCLNKQKNVTVNALVVV